jgi:hypothetical protein
LFRLNILSIGQRLLFLGVKNVFLLIKKNIFLWLNSIKQNQIRLILGQIGLSNVNLFQCRDHIRHFCRNPDKFLFKFKVRPILLDPTEADSTTTTTTTTNPVSTTTTSTSTSTTTTDESIDSCDFYEVKGGLLSCTCYNFSLQAIGIGGTFLSTKLFVTAETELTDSGDVTCI